MMTPQFTQKNDKGELLWLGTLEKMLDTHRAAALALCGCPAPPEEQLWPKGQPGGQSEFQAHCSFNALN